MLSVTYSYCYAESRNDECHYAECNYAECRHAECRHAKCHYGECQYAECRYAGCRHAECLGAAKKNLNGFRVDLVISAKDAKILIN
jgi:hypothetical protein